MKRLEYPLTVHRTFPDFAWTQTEPFTNSTPDHYRHAGCRGCSEKRLLFMLKDYITEEENGPDSSP